MSETLGPEELPEDPDDRTSAGFVEWLSALAAAADEDEVFAILASQRPPASKLARQQVRGRLVKVLGQRLKELESGVSPARTADAWLQEGGEEDGDLLQGRVFVADEIQPWEAPVAGEKVLDEVFALLSAYVYASTENLVALTLFAAYTHLHDCFSVSPILNLSSPTMRCGKSTAIVALRHLCRAPLLSGNITPAALFRAVDAWKPTLLIDEADTFATMNDALRGVLNAGHTRDTAFVVRAEGDANEPRMFSTWAPKIVAAIGRLPGTIEDRSVRVVLARKPTGVSKRDAFDLEAVRSDCAEVRQRLARFALDEIDVISVADAQRPDGLHDRAWNNWRPLLAIASAGGPVWLDRARRAATVLTASGDDGDSDDVGTLALRHVWEVLEPAGRLATADILRYLVAKDDGPWAKWWEASLTKEELKGPSARLAKLLKPFGPKPRDLWIDGQSKRGYQADDFRAGSCAPYLQKGPGEARDPRDPRTGSHGQADPRDPRNPLVSGRGTPRRAPLEGDVVPLCPGDPGYLDLIADAFAAGHLTAAERHQRRLLHCLLYRTTNAPAGEAAILAEVDELAAAGVLRPLPGDWSGL